MSAFEVIALIIGIFFVVGIAVGVLLVVALPVFRAVLHERRGNRRYHKEGKWRKLSSRDDDTKPPRWPGG